MPNKESIDDIVSKAAIDQVTELLKQLDAAEKKMTALVNQTIAFNDAVGKSVALKEFNANAGRAKQTTEQLNVETKVFIQNIKEHNALTEKITKAKSAEAKVNADLKAQLDALNKANTQQARAANEQLDHYQKLVKAQKAAEREYLNLAASIGMEEQATKDAQKVHADLYNQLTKIEQGAGNFKRNVGNYRDSWHSFNQVLREAPAFANSTQTGLMAISNNIPMFIDDIMAARKAGESWGSIMKGLSGTLLSFGGIVTIATTVFTFMPQIMKALGDETEATNKKIKSFNEVQSESLKKANEERVELEAYLVIARDENKSRAERNAAIKAFNDIMPDYIGSLTEENAQTKEADELVKSYIETIQKQALAKAYIAKITDLYSQYIDAENASLSENVSLLESLWISLKNPFDAQKRLAGTVEQATKNIDKQKAAIKGNIDELTAHFHAALKDGSAIAVMDKNTKDYNKTIKATREEIMALAQMPGLASTVFGGLNVEQQKTMLDILGKGKAILTGGILMGNQNLQEIREDTVFSTTKAAELMSKAQKNNEADRQAIREKRRAQTIQDLQEVQKYGGQALDIVGNAIQASIDRQKNAIQEQIDMNEELKQAEIERISSSLASEEDKAARIAVVNARAAAERERLERRQRDLDRRKAIADKAKAVFEAIINTATAVIDALPNIPLAILIGAMGAASLATILAQPVPKFAKGTERSPEGPAIVGEKGRELMVTPEGKLVYTPDRPTLTYLKEGTRIIPNDKLKDIALGNLAIAANGRMISKDAIDFTKITEATSGGADKIVKAIKSQPKQVFTRDGLFTNYGYNKRLADYFTRNLK